MLKGGSLITTALFSYLLLKNKLKRNHIVGCIMAIIGVSIVGVSGILYKSTKSSYPVVYYLLINSIIKFLAIYL